MFRTHTDEMAGLPGMFGEGLAHWHAVSRSLATHWYHVSIKQRHEDRFVSQVEMLNDETKLFELITAQGEDFVVDELQVVTPPWINNGKSWRMEKLMSVSVGYDKNEVSVCLLEVESGAVYVDVHDPTFDASTLTNLRIPRHPATQPTNIRPPVPRSSGQAVGAQRRRFALLV